MSAVIQDINSLFLNVSYKNTGNIQKDVGVLIQEAKEHVAREYNSTQSLLCWLIGKRIEEEILKNERAEYGEEIVASLSKYLTLEYGRGYSRPNLFRMIKFARLFPNMEIVSTLSRQLSWSHFIIICTIEDPVKRDFYAEMSKVQKWSVRILNKEINSMLYERIALSKKSDLVIKTQLDKLKESSQMSVDLTFKDPYFLDFIGAQDFESEEKLESLILDNITKFLQELGTDFCFVARQKRMSTGKKDRYLDLLFFNRRLQRLIAVDLKIGDFDPSYKGQMEWYLSWLDKNERLSWENKPLGIILCAGKDNEDIEYLELDKSGVHVAQYFTQLPRKEILEKHLLKAIEIARETYAKKELRHYKN